jgi:hypothetical protein
MVKKAGFSSKRFDFDVIRDQKRLVDLLGTPSCTILHLRLERGEKRAEFPRCFRTLVVKIEKTNSNSTRDFSKRINFNRVDLFVWSTLVVKIKKRRNPLRAF